MPNSAVNSKNSPACAATTTRHCAKVSLSAQRNFLNRIDAPVSGDSVKLIECPRDAWQGLKKQIPTKVKVRYLRALIAAGFQHIDAVSFVSPKAVPQMTDSEQVLAQ